jgi:hypothetical protein
MEKAQFDIDGLQTQRLSVRKKDEVAHFVSHSTIDAQAKS